MERGYIKLYRKAIDSGLIQHAKAWQFLSWCLLMATHKPYKRMFNGTLFELSPGQLVTSRSEACSILRMTVKEFRNVQKMLENSDFLTSKGASSGTVFSIVNWDRYQQDSEAKGPTEGPAKGPTGGQRGANSARARSRINIQEQENKKSINTILPGDGEDAARGQEATPAEQVYLLPLKAKNSEENNFPVTKELFGVWDDAYPLVDVRAELREIKAWLVSNPKRRPASDMARFVNSWLDKAQNDKSRQEARASPRQGPSPHGNMTKTGEERVYAQPELPAWAKEAQHVAI